MELAKNYSSLEKLQALESQINIALMEQATNIIAEAEVEAASSRTDSNKSKFASRLCEYLDSRKQ